LAEKEDDSDLPKFVFGAVDVMPLVELVNEIYDLLRQHPSMQTKQNVKWMNKFVEFMLDHSYTKPPADAVTQTDNKYLNMVAQGTAKQVIDKMKDHA